jgi:hypothetical protein
MKYGRKYGKLRYQGKFRKYGKLRYHVSALWQTDTLVLK